MFSKEDLTKEQLEKANAINKKYGVTPAEMSILTLALMMAGFECSPKTGNLLRAMAECLDNLPDLIGEERVKAAEFERMMQKSLSSGDGKTH